MSRKYQPLVLTGILAGMSLVFELVFHFPVLGAFPFLLYSPGDLPIIMAAVLVSPMAGVSAAFINSTLFVMLTGQGGPWGALMHFIASGGMVLVIGYLSKKTKGLHWPMLAGILVRVALMVPFNLLITPLYLGTTRAQVMAIILPAIVPFNLIHAGINTAVAYVLLKVMPAKVVAGAGGR